MEHERLRNMTATALMTALLCVLGPVMVPIGPVPISLQVLCVFLCVAVLGMRRGTVAVVLYLLIGFAGLPVF
ncbi:MAG: biotin transporter BioY, partial [Pyramidobacter sp.]|nr:biotin transporter BioY [Pyramidobacter sp.]